MKLHLPVSLRKCLLALMPAVLSVTCGTATAGVMHPDATFQTYTDYGQNLGRYVVGTKVNALLQHIRTDVDKGILIHYTDGDAYFVISNEQGLIDVSGVDDIGAQNAISPTFAATVLHNGSINASYGERIVGIGSEHALNYASIDIRGSNVFRLAPYNTGTTEQYDYMLQRQSKVQTDVNWIPVTTVTDFQDYVGGYIYHIGGGGKGIWNTETNSEVSLADAYSYIIGGINEIQSLPVHDTTGNLSVNQNPNYAQGKGANLNNPLPNAIRGGDSGSPVYIFNPESGKYEYIAAQQSGGGTYGQARGSVKWTHETLESFNARVDLSADSVVYLNAIADLTTSYTDHSGNSAVVYTGHVVDADGNILGDYNALRNGLNTWADLSGIKDVQNWYAYDAKAYLQRSVTELFFNQNLVFTPSQEENRIILRDTVDLGVGYVEFNKGTADKSVFIIESETGESNLLNSAGYVINEGAEVHISFTNPEDHMYEWRKTGTGDLFIEGTGNSNALLNLGGIGKTYLKRQDGYASYNVLLNTGATVVIDNVAQIQRDLTIGSGGGTLDMNGNSMEWYQTQDADGRFTINALTEQAILANYGTNASVLTYKESGEQTYAGSFRDSESGSLTIDYQGGGIWELNSIHTDLSQHDDSGLIVTNGKVLLNGTLTVHGMGSVDGRQPSRLVKDNDWHYADAKMNVDIKSGASFELGSHARLTGDVTVARDATYIMREGVKERYEYVEGGALLEDTYIYRDFYGHKGNVNLEGSMLVQYSEGTTSRNVYTGNISGSGSLTIDLGSVGAILELSGDNSSHTGLKELVSGGLVATNTNALGNTQSHKWLVGSQAWIASQEESGADLLSKIDTNSTGTLALSNNTESELNLHAHTGLFIGAEEGKTVQYGTADKSLTAINKVWNLGGGGGELVVNFLLTGDNGLVLGATDSATGVVTLTNKANTFTGGITFNSTGIILNAVDGALGQSNVDLIYGNAFTLPSVASFSNIKDGADGIVLVDNLSATDIDLTAMPNLALGANGGNVKYNGNISLVEDAAYRFSAVAGGVLDVVTVLSSEHDVVIDAQGLVGGVVKLSGNDSFSGNITVQGHREHNGSGEITLALGRDMSASGTITLMQGGTLDLLGHRLEVQHLIGSNGKVINSVTGGELVFNAADGEVSVDTALQLDTARKTGSGALTLSGNNNLGVFYVDGGALVLGSDSAVGNGSVIYLADGTELRGNGHSHYGDVRVLAGEGTLSQAPGGVTVLHGSIYAEEGAVLTLAGGGAGANPGGITLRSTEHGIAGGTIRLDGVKLTLESDEAFNLNGTVAVAGNSTLYSEGGASDMARNIDDLHIENGAILTVDEHHWSTIWNIGKLSGEGTLHWNSDTTHDTPSVLKLNGTGNFVGSIELNRIFTKDSRPYGAFIELLSDHVAQNADIKLTGKAANAMASLVIKTDNAHIKGLSSGNAHTLVYAGDALAETPEDKPAVPTTTRKATLTIDTAGNNYSYAGVFGHAVESTDLGLSIVKLGAGTQAFTGTTVVNDVTVLGGSLQLASNSAMLRGNVTLATGAALSGVNFVLGADKSFIVEYGTDSSASFSGNLTLGGGRFCLDAYAMAGGQHAVLDIAGTITLAENCNSQTITVQNISSLGVGSYTLATGDWSGVDSGALQLQAGSVYDASLAVVDGILKLNVALKQGSVVWDGTEAAHEWSSIKFGSSEQALGTGAIALFNDNAACKTVTVSENVAVSQAVFATVGTYTVQGQADAVATLSSLTKAGSGVLVLESGVVVNGATIIEDGSLVIKKNGLLNGTIGGDGELVIDWGTSTTGTLSITDLATLHIAGGSYGSKGSGAIDVDNIIVDAGTRYIQGDNIVQTANIVSNGGVLELAGGGVAGALELMADTELYIRSGDVNLDSALTHNGHVLTQTFSGSGAGIMHIDGDSKTVLGRYVVAQGTLSFDGNRVHRGHDTITVENNATLLVGYQSALEANHIILNSGGKLLLRNGYGSNSYVSSDIIVSDGAIISGSLNGNATQINGTISGSGVLYFKSSDTEGTNHYSVNAVISDTSADTPLALQFDNSYVLLTGANTYSGGTTINSGRVTVNNAMGLGSGAVQVNGGSLILDTPGRMTSISGTGGEVYLNNGIYKAQSLNLTGTYLSGTGSLVVTSGGQAVLGGGVSIESLSVEHGATLALGGIVSLDTAILNSGSLILNSGIVFDLDVTKGNNGVYTLISGTGDISYGFDSFTVNNFMLQGSQLSDAISWNITSTENSLQVTISGLMRNRVWTGATSAVWDSITQNWATESGNSATFLVCDKVSFGASAEHKNVSWQGTQYVTDMQVTGGEYSFAGDALIVQNNLEIAAGASASFDCKLDIDGTLKTAGNVSLNITEAYGMNVSVTGGSLIKNGNNQLTWTSAENEPIKLDALTVNAGAFVAESALLATSVSLGNNASVTLSHATGNAVLESVFGTGNTSLTLNAAGSLQLSNVAIKTLTLKGNSNVNIDGSVNVETLSLGKTNVVLESGANVITSRYTSGNTADNQPTQLTINHGAVLSVTGNNSVDATDSSMLLAHWKSAFSELHLNGGELNVNNTYVLMGWDSGGTLRADSGVANLYGIQFSTARTSEDRFVLGSATEGTAEVNVGAHGIKNIGAEDVVSLGCGTLNATADWEATGNGAITFESETIGTIFNTNGYQVTIQSGIDGSGKLLKQGDGTLIIAGNATAFTGMVDVQQGILQLGNATNPVNHVHVSTGGVVQFNEGVTLAGGMTLTGSGGIVNSDVLLNGGSIGADAAWLNAQHAALNIGSGYTVSFAEGNTTQLISIEGIMDLAEGNYYLVNGQFAEGITADNFTLGVFSDFLNASFTLNDSGLWMSVASVEGGVQIWNGTADAHSWSNEVFGSQSNKHQNTVIFTDAASDRHVQIAANIQTGAVIFSNALEYNISSSNVNYGLTADSIELTDAGKVRISTELEVNTISISKGTLELVGKAQFEQMPTLSMTNGATLQLSDIPVTLGAASMEAGTTIADLGGTGELNIAHAVELAGTLNVGTINTMANASFVAGTNLHTLNVVAGVTTVHGAFSASTINLAGGTTLNLVDGYTLATGSTISVAGVTTLGGDIIMAGGTLTFDTALTPDADALISFGGSLSLAENACVNITVKDTLQQSQGGTYVLATGDFSAFETENFNMSGLSDSLWSFSLNEDKTQLSLTLSSFGIWNGTDGSFAWNDSFFGDSSVSLNQNSTAVFNDSAEKTDVLVSENVSVKSVYLDNNKDYTFVASEGALLTTDSLVKSGTGSVSFGVDMNIGSGVSFNGCSILFEGDTSIEGALSTSNSAEVYFGADAEMSSISMDSGTLTFGGADSSVTVDGKLYAKRGILNIGSSPEDSVFLTVNTLEASDSNNAGNLTINLAEGSTLKITGHDDVGNYKTTAFLLSEWNAVTTLNVDGTILSQNASLLVGDSGANINISGTVAVRGIGNGNTNKNGGTITLDMQDGAKLILGASGISAGKQFVANLGASTIGISAEAVTIAEDLTITSDSGTVFDTAIYKFADDGNSIIQTTKGGILTISGTLTGDGKLIKQGAGELKLTASAFNYVGELDVNAGSLTIYNTGAADGANKHIRKVVLSDGSVLQTYDAQAPTVATSFDCIQLESGAFATVQDVNHSGYIAINNLCGGADSTLKLIKNAQSDHTGIFVLGAEAVTSNDHSFAGTIELHQASVSDNRNRDVTLQLNHASIAKDSVISLGSTAGTGARLGLGVNVKSATISGLTSGSSVGTRAIVYSGAMGHGQTWNIAKPTVNNELIINTADNTEYTYYGQLQNIDITKNGDGTQIFAGSSAEYNGAITINAGVLQFETASLGMLNAASSITVNKSGTLDLTNLGSSALLDNVSGTGIVVLDYAVSGNGTSFNFNSFTGTVQVAGGRVLLSSSQKGNIAPNIVLTSSNSELVFDGTGTVWNGNVSLLADTAIHVNSGKDGELSGTLSGQKLTKRGAGSLLVSGGVDLAALNIIDGEVVITNQNNEVGSLECSVNGDKTGKLRLSAQSQLTINGDIVAAVPANTDIVILEKGASLTSTQDSVIFSNRQGNQYTSLKTSSADEEYSIGSSTYVLSNGHLQYTKNEDAELKNKLTNSSVAFSPENANVADALHILTVNNEDNTLTGIFAEGGNINVQNQASHSLQELKVAAGLTVGAYTGSSISASDEALIKVSQMAQFGHGATLNADLVMETGATLQMDGTVTMGSDLTLMAGLTLTGSQYDEVRNLIADGESKVVLFEGIDKLILGDTEYTASISMDKNILAHTYFGNIGSDYLLVYDATVPGNGVLSIMAAVPEPSTATLSLLALAALVARRRRR